MAALVESVVKALATGNLRQMRQDMTWRAALINGFSPIPPITVLIPIKIVLFIIILIILLAVGAGWWSLPIAYIAHALIIACTAVYIIDKLLGWVPGL